MRGSRLHAALVQARGPAPSPRPARRRLHPPLRPQAPSDPRPPRRPAAAALQGPPQNFGSAFTCAIADTVTQDSEASEGSLEYLVFTRVFIAIAESFGLVPVGGLGRRVAVYGWVAWAAWVAAGLRWRWRWR
jgi:hypothetical protein